MPGYGEPYGDQPIAPLTLAQLPAAPGSVPSAVQLYGFAVSGVTNLYAQLSDGTTMLLSPSGGAAPDDATYLTNGANSTLSAEVDITATGTALSWLRPITYTATTWTHTQTAATSGSPNAYLLTAGAHTTLAASTEAIDINFNLARTVQFATGALTTQRAIVIVPPQYAFVGASTLSTTATMTMTAPAAGNNATFANTYALQVGGAQTIGPTSAAMVYAPIIVPAHTMTVTGGTAVTGSSAIVGIRIEPITLTDSSAVTITGMSSLYISGPPVQAGSVTATNLYTARLEGTYSDTTGTLRTGLSLSQTFNPASGTVAYVGVSVAYTLNQAGTGSVAGISVNATETAIGGTHNLMVLQTGSVARFTVAGGVTTTAGAGMVTMAPQAATGGTPTLLTLTGPAHTTLAASTEAIDINFNLARTVQFAMGALAVQRAFSVAAPTYSFAGASTVTSAIVASFGGACVASTNATFTNSYVISAGGNASIGPTSALMTYATINIPPHTMTVTGTTQVTTSTSAFSALALGQITITDASAVTINNAATLYIANAPAAAGSVTLTNAYALWIDNGAARFDGNLGFFSTAPVAQPAAYTQTYATATRTHANLTATAVSTTASTQTTPWGYTTQAQADAIPVAINALEVDLANVKQVLNSVIDDLQAYGLLA